MTRARVIADSVNTMGDRITTMILRYPRIIHAEMLTHRAFSRNAASSRAIPVQKMIAAVEADPFIPPRFGQNQRGMQAGEPLDPDAERRARANWQLALNESLDVARRLARLGVHKQWVNRLLEPFSYIEVIVTATEWDNFFALRLHPAAQPEMQELARAMRAALDASTPEPKAAGEWHIPFGDKMPEGATLAEQLKIATARACRISYLTHDGEFSPERDFQRHDESLADKHWSPFEHCARAASGHMEPVQGNFEGWHQYRHIIREGGVGK